MKKQQKLLLGAHISIAGGMQNIFDRAESIGCTALQFFTKSNRQWKAKKLASEDVETFKQAKNNSSIKHTMVHASYLINLGSPNEQTQEKSKDALIVELDRCNTLEVPYLILHPGSHLKTDKQECLERIAQSLNEIFEKYPGKTSILLETMAGQGSSVCHQFEDLAFLLSKIKNKKRVGICFDTCHVFAAGYDFSTKENYKKMWQEFDEIVGIKNIKAFHINDSKKDCGSKVDRHENIGKGKMSLNSFKLLFNDPQFFSVPKVLETPDGTLEEYAKNIEVIKKLIF